MQVGPEKHGTVEAVPGHVLRFTAAAIGVACILAPVQASATAGADPARAWQRVVIDLSEQSVTVFDSAGTEVRRWPVSTGASGTPTPVGRFSVQSKSRHTFVRDNPAVTMEHMVRFRGGIGFHGIPRRNGIPMFTPLGERPVSHGCIRLADAHARELYQRLPVGAVVVVRR